MSKPAVAVVSVAGTLIAVALVLLIVLYSGAYDISASSGHSETAHWILETLQHNSISARASEVEGALPTDQASLRTGFEHYHRTCVPCHGGPGASRGEPGMGITPTPPDLREEAPEWSDQELFWIVKNGIKLAGMPAFGATHDDDELWAVAAFVRALPDMTPEEYQRRARSLEGTDRSEALLHEESPGGHER